MVTRIPSQLDVQIVEQWDGQDRSESRLAMLALLFEDLEPSIEAAAAYEKDSTLRALVPRLQELVADRFPGAPLHVEGLAVRRGTLEVTILILAAGTALYKLLKDYPDLRQGAVLLAKDIHRRRQAS